jgi:ribosome biogenesis GTPase A
LLLINKSDFLSEDLIKHWNAYFVEKKIKHLFFSALTEQERLDAGEDEF